MRDRTKPVLPPISNERMTVNVRQGKLTPSIIKNLVKKKRFTLLQQLPSLFLEYGENLELIIPYIDNLYFRIAVTAMIKGLKYWSKRNKYKTFKLFKKKK